jgi:hypothetical protein
MPTSPPRLDLRRAPALLTALLLICLAGSDTGLASAQAAAPSPATTPTTTYVPSGGAAVAGAATPATPSTAATTTPAVSIPASATAQPVASTPSTAGTQAPAARAKASKGDRPLSTGAIVIAALAALLLLGILGWALARRRAFEPHWLLALRHAMAEAGFRASATWSEFADWARLGH